MINTYTNSKYYFSAMARHANSYFTPIESTIKLISRLTTGLIEHPNIDKLSLNLLRLCWTGTNAGSIITIVRTGIYLRRFALLK